FAPPAYRIEVDPGQEPGVRLLAETLRRQAWAGRTEVDGATVRVQVKDPDAAAMRLVPLLGTAGLRISLIERERPTLEDVFLELVAHDDGEADGDAGGGPTAAERRAGAAAAQAAVPESAGAEAAR
ncbi:MAG TPA: DUF4162 domain-containing protein, partial [Candidatus Limnocylindrales bacterium]